MNKFKTILSAILVLFIVGCSSTHKAKVDFDSNPDVDTSNYKTFAWMKQSKILITTQDINPVRKLVVDDAIEEAFIAKGYQLIEDPEKADFVISYTVGSRDKIKVDSYPATYHGGWGWGRGYYGGYHGMTMGTETRVRNYTEGSLAIDVFDVKSHQPAWHGSAVKRITSSDEENWEQSIRMIVNQTVAQFL